MNKIIGIVLICSVLLSSCNSDNHAKEVAAFEAAIASIPKTPEQLRMELKKQEQEDPPKYLVAHGTMSENKVQSKAETLFKNAEFKTDGYYIEGTIKNSASVARFKDIVINVEFVSKTGTVIESKDFPFYEFYEPNSTLPFNIHAYPPVDTKNFRLKVKKATPID